MVLRRWSAIGIVRIRTGFIECALGASPYMHRYRALPNRKSANTTRTKFKARSLNLHAKALQSMLSNRRSHGARRLSLCGRTRASFCRLRTSLCCLLNRRVRIAAFRGGWVCRMVGWLDVAGGMGKGRGLVNLLPWSRVRGTTALPLTLSLRARQPRPFPSCPPVRPRIRLRFGTAAATAKVGRRARCRPR